MCQPSKRKIYIVYVKFTFTWLTQLITESSHQVLKDGLSTYIYCLSYNVATSGGGKKAWYRGIESQSGQAFEIGAMR